MSITKIRVFISYKWEEENHNKWVEKLATDLRSAGIDAILDKWEVRFGDSLTDYMISRISEADAVLFIMTKRSVAAAEAQNGKGGAVKFEMQMATSRRIAGERMRLIGIFREGMSTPAQLRDHRYADFRNDSEYELRLRELIDDLLDRNSRPPLNITSKSSATNLLSLFEFETVTLDKNEQIIDRRKGQAQCFTERINGVPLEMVLIPSGKFLMGQPGKADGSIFSDLAMPQHWVTIAKPLFVGKYLITQEQYEALIGVNPSRFSGKDLPVEKVSWQDAIEFCFRLSVTTGRNYRLPSEAEWEYACRAGTTTSFSFGDIITTNIANFNGEKYSGPSNRKNWIYRDRTTTVGSFRVANRFGLYDMHGNLGEWCMDVWHNSYEGAPTDGSSWMETEWGITEHTQRVMRSGPWYEGFRNSTSYARHGPGGSIRNDGYGFRIVTDYE